jgi:non-ribosomal peptide synthetase component F
MAGLYRPADRWQRQSAPISRPAREYRISARDLVVQLASLAFDTSIEQVRVALACNPDTAAAAHHRLHRPAPLPGTKRVSVIDPVPRERYLLLARSAKRSRFLLQLHLELGFRPVRLAGRSRRQRRIGLLT